MIVEPALSFNPSEHEAERASGSYVMSVIALMVGLPLPIVNLLATLLFYLANRRSTSFVRWHCTQALLSQFTVLFMNSAGLWWTVSIVFRDGHVSNRYIAYLITIFIFNVSEFSLTVYTAVQTRKGKHIEWWFWGTLTNSLLSSERHFKKALVQFVLMAIAFFGVWAALSRFEYFSEKDIQEMSVANEDKLGDMMMAILDKEEFVYSESADAMMDRLKQRLCKDNGIDPSSIKIQIYESAEENAFAFPDSNIIVYTGLIYKCRSAEEMAGVLAHEIGHVELGHVSERLAKEFGLAALSVLVRGDSPNDIPLYAVKLLLSKTFDRTQESNADDIAVDLMLNAGIDPEHLSDLFLRLAEDSGDNPDIVTWVSSHPETLDRSDAILARRNLSDFTERALSSADEWTDMQEALASQRQ